MKKVIVCYFASIGAMLGFAVALINTWVPMMILFILAFVASLIWFAKIMEGWEADQWKLKRFYSDKFNEIEKQLERFDIEISLKEDAHGDRRGSVSPGSRTSITYENMKAIQEGREINENIRTEA